MTEALGIANLRRFEEVTRSFDSIVGSARMRFFVFSFERSPFFYADIIDVLPDETSGAGSPF